MFGFFKKKFPMLKPEMISPVDQPISTTDAKRIFKDFMKEIGFLEKGELAEHAGYLGEEIREHESMLREEVQEKKEDQAHWKGQIKDLKAKAKSASGELLEDLQSEIEGLEEELQASIEETEQAKAAVAAFKSDKRAFLVDYINRQTQANQ